MYIYTYTKIQMFKILLYGQLNNNPSKNVASIYVYIYGGAAYMVVLHNSPVSDLMSFIIRIQFSYIHAENGR